LELKVTGRRTFFGALAKDKWIGTNNTGRDSAQDIADGVRSVVAEYEERCPHAHIVLMAIFPRGRTPNDPSRMKVEAVNRLISTLDDGQRVSFVDIGSSLIERDGTISATMMPDFVHPATQGYVTWAGAIKPLVKKYLAVEEGTMGTIPSSGPVPPSYGDDRR
jgi:lysophospholipase L1-like esterase